MDYASRQGGQPLQPRPQHLGVLVVEHDQHGQYGDFLLQLHFRLVVGPREIVPQLGFCLDPGPGWGVVDLVAPRAHIEGGVVDQAAKLVVFVALKRAQLLNGDPDLVGEQPDLDQHEEQVVHVDRPLLNGYV